MKTITINRKGQTMNYWKLLSTTAILMTTFCVGIFFYARWDLKRFEESLGEPPPPISQKMESTENLSEQTTFGKTVTFKTDAELGFVKQQETEPQITDIDGGEASRDAGLASFDALEDERLDAHLENPDITDAADDAFANFLQKQIANSSGKDASLITIEGLDATQTSGWIEIEGDLSLGDIIDIDIDIDTEGLSEGDYIIIDKTGVIHRTE